MSPGIIISLVVIVAILGGGYAMYQRYLRGLAPDENVRPVSGARLTSERLRTLANPPWRVVFEIGDDKLPGVDHIVIGPSGAIAIATTMADRPGAGADDDANRPDPHIVAASATLRADVDSLARPAGVSCDVLARVYWGAPQPDQPPAFESMHATMAVEGQRLVDWLLTLPPGPYTASQVDLGWQAVVTGIGRPDPLA